MKYLLMCIVAFLIGVAMSSAKVALPARIRFRRNEPEFKLNPRYFNCLAARMDLVHTCRDFIECKMVTDRVVYLYKGRCTPPLIYDAYAGGCTHHYGRDCKIVNGTHRYHNTHRYTGY